MGSLISLLKTAAKHLADLSKLTANMGKQNGGKLRQSGQQTGRMPAFFLAAGTSSGPASLEQLAANMAPASPQGTPSTSNRRSEAVAQTGEPAEMVGDLGNGDSLTTRHDLAAVSTDLKNHLSTLIESNMASINSQLRSLSDSLKEVADTASRAYDMATASEKAVADLKTSEK